MTVTRNENPQTTDKKRRCNYEVTTFLGPDVRRLDNLGIGLWGHFRQTLMTSIVFSYDSCYILGQRMYNLTTSNGICFLRLLSLQYLVQYDMMVPAIIFGVTPTVIAVNALVIHGLSTDKRD